MTKAKVRSLRRPVNESPAQQPGFFLPIFCAGFNGACRHQCPFVT
jgi:hypothetical protein